LFIYLLSFVLRCSFNNDCVKVPIFPDFLSYFPILRKANFWPCEITTFTSQLSHGLCSSLFRVRERFLRIPYVLWLRVPPGGESRIKLFLLLLLFRTKALEEKYFEEANELRSKLEIAEEEKKRFAEVTTYTNY